MLIQVVPLSLELLFELFQVGKQSFIWPVKVWKICCANSAPTFKFIECIDCVICVNISFRKSDISWVEGEVAGEDCFNTAEISSIEDVAWSCNDKVPNDVGKIVN